MSREAEESFLKTVSNSDLQGALKSATEAGIDSLLDSDALKSIPVVGTIFGLSKAGLAIRDWLFLKKLFRFLEPLVDVSAEERLRFLENLSDDQRQKVAEYMLLHIDRLDSLEKPEMLGRIFRAFMEGEIDYRTMLYFSHYVDQVFIVVWNDYRAVLEKYHETRAGTPSIPIDDARALRAVGFYEEKYEKEQRPTGDRRKVFLRDFGVRLELSDAGWRFIQVVFRLWADDEKEMARSWLSVNVPRS